MKDGDDFPLISTIYDGKDYWLIDGFHRYLAIKLLGTREIEINYERGSIQDAQILSFGVNNNHGMPRTNEDKRNAVINASKHPLMEGKTENQIAKVCNVSHSFVAAILRPERKERQKENIRKTYEKQAATNKSSDLTSSEKLSSTQHFESIGPDDDEIRASEIAMEEYLQGIQEVMDSEDKLASLHEEYKKLSEMYAQVQLRFNGLMNEKNQAIEIIKARDKEIVKLRKMIHELQNDGK
jgi:archaellum component FlaC